MLIVLFFLFQPDPNLTGVQRAESCLILKFRRCVSAVFVFGEEQRRLDRRREDTIDNEL